MPQKEIIENIKDIKVGDMIHSDIITFERGTDKEPTRWVRLKHKSKWLILSREDSHFVAFQVYAEYPWKSTTVGLFSARVYGKPYHFLYYDKLNRYIEKQPCPTGIKPTPISEMLYSKGRE